ncbi:MAG: helix-turn-helix domain-containing protein [bacterium]
MRVLSNTPGNPEKLISISKAAETLGVAIQTLRRWDQSGRLVAKKSVGGQRRYSLNQLKQMAMSNSFKVAELWVKSESPTSLNEEVYCSNRAVFETRLQSFNQQLENNVLSLPLVVAIAGEIGNNSFDHNIGNWPDVPGVFFAFDLERNNLVLADRGRGLLTTLQKVRPSLTTHQEALEVGFTEVLTGRAPEKRGNGLKFVKKAIQSGTASITFQTGNAKLTMIAGANQFQVVTTPDFVRGTLVSLDFNNLNK